MEAIYRKPIRKSPDNNKTRMAMDAARAQAESGPISYEVVRLAAGYTRSCFGEFLSRKIKQGEWRWTNSDPKRPLQDKSEVPGERERIRQEWTANMLRETRHSPGRPPEQTPAEACRLYLREWRKLRRARRAEQTSSAPDGSSCQTGVRLFTAN